VPVRFPRLTPTVKKLLILLTAAFVLVAVLQNLAELPAFELLALSPRLHDGFWMNLLWQPFTYWLAYPPVPDALFSFALTALFLYFFLAPFEEAFGAKRTVQLTAIAVIAAAAAAILLSLLVPPRHLLAGADPIALAALGAFPIVAGNREILFMFVIPMRVWTVILLGLGFAALASVLARDPFIFAMDAAALGAGVAFTKWMTRPRSPAKRKSSSGPKKRRPGPDLRLVRGQGADDERPRYLN
jgi:membrane associated rhomboid family serine protease